MVALDERGQTVLAGSCKWTNEPMDAGDYAALQRDLAIAAGALRPIDGEGPWLALFSREGFTERLRTLAAAQQPSPLLLVDLGAMYSA